LFIHVTQTMSLCNPLFSLSLLLAIIVFLGSDGLLESHVLALKQINNCITMIKLFVKMLHIRTGKLITVREVKIQNLLFDEFKSLDLKLSLLLY